MSASPYLLPSGVVLRRTDTKEADQILTLLTAEHGKIPVIARGVKRKGCRYAAAAGLLAYSDWSLYHRGDWYYANEAETKELFSGLGKDFLRLSLGCYFAELTEALTAEGEESGELLRHLLNGLYAVENFRRPPELLRAAFELRAMSLAGYEPLLEGCAYCGKAEPEDKLIYGPNIKDWPAMAALPENLLLKVVSEIHDPVTTTDELIPSGETSSYRSNPLGLAEFTLSRKDPEYVGRAKEIQKAQKAIEAGNCPLDAVPELKTVMDAVHAKYPEAGKGNLGVGSTIFAVKPGDGSAREQAASCQKVLGGWANIANSYATKRYRSNLINWGMLPFLIDEGELPFKNGDYLFVPHITEAVKNGAKELEAYVVKDGQLHAFTLKLGEMTPEEREIILKGCLINYNRV